MTVMMVLCVTPASVTHLLGPGCPSKSASPEICADTGHAAAVRCCARGKGCLSVCGRTHGRSNGVPPRQSINGFAANWTEAVRECEAHGASLCTSAQLSQCCKTGCAMDNLLVWTRSGARCGVSRQTPMDEPARDEPPATCKMAEAPMQVKIPRNGSRPFRHAQAVLDDIIRPARAGSTWAIYYPLVAAFINAEVEPPGDRLAPPKPLTVVEVGTAFGGNADHLVSALRGATVTAVDPLLEGYDPNDAQSRFLRKAREKLGLEQPAFSRAWATALAMDAEQRHGRCRYRMLHTTGEAAAATWADGSVDILFLDGLHTEAGVMADLTSWWPKLTPNEAVVLFNDYDTAVGARHPGVARAVHTFLKARGQTRADLCVGGKGRPPGEGNAALCLRGRCRSPGCS